LIQTGSFRERVIRFFADNEKWIFLLIVLLNALPVLVTKYYLSQDGPAHLYNSVILRDLLFGNDPSMHKVFELNHYLVPNLTTHVIMALASFVFPVWIAEKIVLLLFFIGFPYAFRYFLKKSGNQNLMMASLIIPVTFSYFLFMGFYNFLFALLPFFILITNWSDPGKRISFVFGVKLFLWLALLYFSHIYVFVLALLVMGLYSLTNFIFQKEKLKLRFLFRDLFFLVLISLPTLLLAAQFLSKTSIVDLHINSSIATLVDNLVHFNSIYDGFFGRKLTSKMALLIFILFICAIVIRLVKFRKKQIALLNSGDVWLITVFILLILYFTIPDYLGGGMNCLRIQQLLIICLITWVALQPFYRWISVTAIAAMLLLQTVIVRGYYLKEYNFSDAISEWIETGKHIDKGTITLPVVFTDNEHWMHCSGYLGATANITLIDNYEAGLLWFPVIWNNNSEFRIKGQEKKNPVTDNRNPAIVDYHKPVTYVDNVLIYGFPHNRNDSISFQSLDSTMQGNYVLVYQSANMKLFKQKK
jgi:hypothetical protein